MDRQGQPDEPSGTVMLTLMEVDESDTPASARGRELFGNVVNGGSEGNSTSSTIADRVEQLVCGAPDKNLVITEASISRNFGVGRRVARQVNRILQQRGIMEPRRGGHSLGGLRIVEPDLEHTQYVIQSEMAKSATAAELKEADHWLAPAINDVARPLAGFVQSVLHSGTGPRPDHDFRFGLGSQAGTLVDVLLAEMATRHHDDPFLGSIAHIAVKHDVSLDIAVEAVRILSDAQRVDLRRGRGGGVYLTRPKAGRALHVANAFLATSMISPSECRRVLDKVNLAMIELARQRRNQNGLICIDASFYQMQNAPNPTSLGLAWYAFIREIADMSANPLLHFMARTLASSILMRRTRSAELPASAARALLQASQQIRDHLRGENACSVEAAQMQCQRALENYW